MEVETFVVDGIEVKVHVDTSPSNPFEEWDTLSVLVGWSSRYKLGKPSSADRVSESIQRDEIAVIRYLVVDDRGVRATENEDRADGAVFVTWDRARKEYETQPGNEVLAKCMEVLNAELKAFQQYADGEVYGYTIDGNHGPSCWGYYGHDHDKSGLREAATESAKAYAAQLKTYFEGQFSEKDKQMVLHGLSLLRGALQHGLLPEGTIPYTVDEVDSLALSIANDMDAVKRDEPTNAPAKRKP